MSSDELYAGNFGGRMTPIACLRSDNANELKGLIGANKMVLFVKFLLDFHGNETKFNIVAAAIRFKAEKCLDVMTITNELLSPQLSDSVPPLHVAFSDNWEYGVIKLLEIYAKNRQFPTSDPNLSLIDPSSPLFLFDQEKKTPLAYLADVGNISLLLKLIDILPKATSAQTPFECVFIDQERKSFLSYCVIHQLSDMINTCGRAVQKDLISSSDLLRAFDQWKASHSKQTMPTLLLFHHRKTVSSLRSELSEMKHPAFPPCEYAAAESPKSLPSAKIIQSIHYLRSITCTDFRCLMPILDFSDPFELPSTLIRDGKLWCGIVPHLALQIYFDDIFKSNLFVDKVLGEKSFKMLNQGANSASDLAKWEGFGVVMAHCALSGCRAEIPSLHPFVYTVIIAKDITTLESQGNYDIEQYFYLCNEEIVANYRENLLSEFLSNVREKGGWDIKKLEMEKLVKKWLDLLSTYRPIVQALQKGFSGSYGYEKAQSWKFSSQFYDVIRKSSVPAMRLWFEGPLPEFSGVEKNGKTKTLADFVSIRLSKHKTIEVDKAEFERFRQVFLDWVRDSPLAKRLIIAAFGRAGLIYQMDSLARFVAVANWHPIQFALIFPVLTLTVSIVQSADELDQMALDAIKNGFVCVRAKNISEKYPEFSGMETE